MRIKRDDAEDFEPDKSSVLRHYAPDDAAGCSITQVEIDGTHENASEAELTYYVLSGEGHAHLDGRIVEMDEGDVVYAGKDDHTLEGKMQLLAVRIPAAETPDEAL